jgi:hypothetical protein
MIEKKAASCLAIVGQELVCRCFAVPGWAPGSSQRNSMRIIGLENLDQDQKSGSAGDNLGSGWNVLRKGQADGVARP